MKLNVWIAVGGAFLVGTALGINGHKLVYGQSIAQLGTMADWAMVLVTAVTLYFLYQQFAEMKKQTDISETYLYYDEMKEIFLRMASSLYSKIRPEKSYAHTQTIWGAFEDYKDLLERYAEEYTRFLKNGDKMSLIDAVQKTLSRIDISLFDKAEIQEISRYCKRTKYLYDLIRKRNIQNDTSYSFYAEYSAFAEDFLKREQEFIASSAMPPRNDEMESYRLIK